MLEAFQCWYLLCHNSFIWGFSNTVWVSVGPTSYPCWLKVRQLILNLVLVTDLTTALSSVSGQMWKSFMDWVVKPFSCSTSWVGCQSAQQRLTLRFPPLNPLWLNICWLIYYECDLMVSRWVHVCFSWVIVVIWHKDPSVSGTSNVLSVEFPLPQSDCLHVSVWF